MRSVREMFFPDEEQITSMPRQKKAKSEAKQSAMNNNTAIQAWREAAKQLGYLQQGKFLAIPARGTPEHLKIKERQMEIMKEKSKTEPESKTPELVSVLNPSPIVSVSKEQLPTTELVAT